MNRLRRRPVAVWYHPSYRLPLAQSVGPPMDPKRADDALTWAVHVGLVDAEDVRSPDELSFEDAARVHAPAWLASIDRAEVVARVLGADAARIPVAPLLETWRRACGATRAAALWVRGRGGRAVNLLGGFHHAEPDRGGGFCAINDVAVAVACVRADGFRGPITVVDLDAHPPDGIVACLGGDPGVTVLSISVASAWALPAATAARVRDARVPAGCGDLGYLAALHELLRQDRPGDLVFYLAGADPLRGDRLGGLEVTLEGLAERDRRVLAWLGDTPAVIVPAGGYSADAWKVVAHTVAAAAGLRAEVDPGFDPLRWRTRRVARTLDPSVLAGRDEGALLTEEELLGGLGVGVREPRFLGYYTRHGLEQALTAYGYLPTLARMGFRGLAVEVQTTPGAPDRMLVSADLGGRRDVVVDLAASFRALGPFRTLFVEWLELKDPRVDFSSARPRLPGQSLPGLGLAEETMQLLVAAAERLSLDGVCFVPAHYHVAWIARSRFVIWNPVARGRFEALARHTARVPLAEVSRRLGGDGWPTEHGDPVRWAPTEMVIPLAPALSEAIAAGAPAAAAARDALADRLG